MLRSRSDKTKSNEVAANNQESRSKSLNINKQQEQKKIENKKKATSKRGIDTESGKSNNRRAQSADVSHDQSTMSMFKNKKKFHFISILIVKFILS